MCDCWRLGEPQPRVPWRSELALVKMYHFLVSSVWWWRTLQKHEEHWSAAWCVDVPLMVWGLRCGRCSADGTKLSNEWIACQSIWWTGPFGPFIQSWANIKPERGNSTLLEEKKKHISQPNHPIYSQWKSLRRLHCLCIYVTLVQCRCTSQMQRHTHTHTVNLPWGNRKPFDTQK